MSRSQLAGCSFLGALALSAGIAIVTLRGWGGLFQLVLTIAAVAAFCGFILLLGWSVALAFGLTQLPKKWR